MKLPRFFRKRKQSEEKHALYTEDDVRKVAEEYGEIRYNDGKRDGIAIARKAAEKSLKEAIS